ncbi:MAG: tyrosine-type recombinase/integrase, partial [Candidatus Thermoplasmatota archaeon]
YWAMIRKDYYFPIPETEEIDIKPLTEMEIEKIIQCAKNDSFSYALLLTLKDTIQRESDIRNIDIDDINFEELTITFKKTKGGKRHVAPITQRTADAIKKYIARDRVSPQGGSNALFVSKLGKRICKNVIEHRVKYYTQKARIEKRVYPHLFRHSGITIMDKNGVSPKTGMAISGHRDEKSYLRYCHPDRQHIRKEFERTIGNNYHPNEIANNFTTVTPSVYIKEQNFSDEDLERLLTIRLATGAIDSETYKLALAQLKKNASKEKI